MKNLMNHPKWIVSFSLLFSSLIIANSPTAQCREHDLTNTSGGDGIRLYTAPLGAGLPTGGTSAGQSNLTLGGDVFGIYQTIHSQGMLGGLIKHTMIKDSFDVPANSGRLSSITSQVTEIGPSLMLFSNEVGEGFIGRFDLSLVSVGYTENYNGAVAGLPGQSAAATSWSGRSSLGFGATLGSGYAVPISATTSFLINLAWNYRNAKIEGRSLNYRTIHLSLGLLF